jgi:hypothetical protein
MIIGIIGGVLLVLVLTCGGIVFYVVYSAKQAAAKLQADVNAAAARQQDEFNRQIEVERKAQEAAQKRAEEQRKKEDEERKAALKEADKKFQAEQDKIKKAREDKIAARRGATAFANTFISEAKEGRIAAAYAMTSAGYRQRVSQEQFTKLIGDQNAGLRAARPFRESFVDSDPPFSYTEKCLPKGGFVTIEVTVVKEGDGWKVDRFLVAKD